jgi:tetratricopeptide (TPR) repeat protein
LSAVVSTLNNLTYLYINRKKPKEAEKSIIETLLIQRKLAETSPSSQDLELVRALILAGFTYRDLEDTAKSQAAFQEAIVIAGKYPDVPLAKEFINTANKNLKK